MYPREAPAKPLQINHAARFKFAGGTLAGFCVLGGAIIYYFDLVRSGFRIDPDWVRLG